MFAHNFGLWNVKEYDSTSITQDSCNVYVKITTMYMWKGANRVDIPHSAISLLRWQSHGKDPNHPLMCLQQQPHIQHKHMRANCATAVFIHAIAKIFYQRLPKAQIPEGCWNTPTAGTSCAEAHARFHHFNNMSFRLYSPEDSHETDCILLLSASSSEISSLKKRKKIFTLKKYRSCAVFVQL